jgi:hypothetical protein
VILLISTSQVARITGVSHWQPTCHALYCMSSTTGHLVCLQVFKIINNNSCSYKFVYTSDYFLELKPTRSKGIHILKTLGQAWWCMPGISALRRLKLEDLKFQAILSNKVRPCLNFSHPIKRLWGP